MYVSVDDDQAPTLTEGYCYRNQNGSLEYVRLGTSSSQFKPDDTVYIEDSLSSYCEIYVKDIPLLIKALHAAYDHKGKP